MIGELNFMKIINAILIFIILSISLLLSTYAHAYSKKDDYINQLYKNYDLIVNTHEEVDTICYDNAHIAFDYSIEILKVAPGSIHAYFVLTDIPNFEINEELKNKYYQLRNKYFSQLDDVDNDLAEKLILIGFTLSCVEFVTGEQLKSDVKICNAALIKIKDECKDENYAALALTILFRNEVKAGEYIDDFLKKYPNHPAIPFVELAKISLYWVNQQYQNCIEETSKWCIKYKELYKPEDCKAVTNGYNLIVLCYIDMNDPENAQKYYDMIANEYPNYSTLYSLKQQIEYIKEHGPFKK